MAWTYVQNDKRSYKCTSFTAILFQTSFIISKRVIVIDKKKIFSALIKLGFWLGILEFSQTKEWSLEYESQSKTDVNTYLFKKLQNAEIRNTFSNIIISLFVHESF